MIGEISSRGNLRRRKVWSGKNQSGKCQSEVSPWGSVIWGTVRLKKRPAVDKF